MAMGRYSRVDGRKSSSYCSTVSIVVFVAFCLVGVWMLMSSSVVPIENEELSPPETKHEFVKQKITENDSRQFEDSSGDLPEDETKKDGNVSEERENQNIPEKESENSEEKIQEETSTEKSDAESEGGDSNTGDGDETKDGEQQESQESSSDIKQESEESDNKSESQDSVDETKQDEQNSNEKIAVEEKEQVSNEVFPAGAQSEILSESTTQNGDFSTQAMESKNEKESQESSLSNDQNRHGWKLCNVTAGPDYIPCLDNWQVIKKLPSTKHYEHRERHCPDEPPTCLVSLPEGYKRPIQWPKSRDQIWYYNVPHTKLAEVKGHQNWVKVTGEYLTFPGGGTQFKNGALRYIDFIQEAHPDIAWGKRSRVVLDVGCGVASFGGYLFERDVIAMSLAPKDEHEAQVQFALERGIPAISAVMGTKRLPFPGRVFDIVHCARCRVPWHIEGGKLLLELNRLLRPGGYFVWSATPVYQKLPEDVGIWNAMSALTKSMCWELVKVKRDRVNEVAAAIYRKPMSNECYENRPKNDPPLCKKSDDPDAAWNVQLQACMHRVAVDKSERGAQWPELWPLRVETAPYWLKSSQVGVYGKSAPEDFTADYEHWKRVVSQSYMKGIGISWSNVRNVMDMRAVYGGFAAALRDLKVWVMNVVPTDSPDTLPIIYERGLFGIYHDWCESLSTYPRSYDLLHADHLFSIIKKRCKVVALFAEVDRILRPEGKLIVRDDVETVSEIESMAKSMQWQVRLTYSSGKEGLLCVQKTKWRPTDTETITSAIARA